VAMVHTFKAGGMVMISFTDGKRLERKPDLIKGFLKLILHKHNDVNALLG